MILVQLSKALEPFYRNEKVRPLVIFVMIFRLRTSVKSKT